MPPARFAIILWFGLLLAVPALRAGPWEEAQTAFNAGDYAKALPLYEEVLKREGPSAARLFNLANTHAQLGQTGPAVHRYEQAALLAPRAADIQKNLKETRPPQAALSVTRPAWWQMPFYWLSLNEWSWMTAAGLILTALPLLIRGFLTNIPAWVRPASPLMIGTGLSLALLGGSALQVRSSEKHLAIVTAREPILRLSPFATANPVDAPPPLPGQRVIPGERHGGWVHLSVPGSTAAGWVPAEEVEYIIPRS